MACNNKGLATNIRRKCPYFILHIVLIFSSIIMIIPFVWMVSTGFKEANEVLVIPPKLFPGKLNLKNFRDVFQSVPFARYFFNSIIVTLCTVTGQLITSSLAAYAFAKMKFRFREPIFFLFLGTMMVPLEVTLIPNYIMMSKFGLLDTYFSLVVPWLASVFGIFLLREFFKVVPDDLFEAASMDGCGHLNYLFRVMLPVSKPAIISVACINGISCWNAFLWPLIVTNSTNMRTLPVGLAYFTFEYSSRFHLMMAASTFATIPVLIFYFIARKHLVQSISVGGLK